MGKNINLDCYLVKICVKVCKITKINFWFLWCFSFNSLLILNCVAWYVTHLICFFQLLSRLLVYDEMGLGTVQCYPLAVPVPFQQGKSYCLMLLTHSGLKRPEAPAHKLLLEAWSARKRPRNGRCFQWISINSRKHQTEKSDYKYNLKGRYS